MERLGLDAGLRSQVSDGSDRVAREVFALTFGLERAERIALVNKYFPGFGLPSGAIVDTGEDWSTVSEAHQTMQITQYLKRYGGLTTI